METKLKNKHSLACLLLLGISLLPLLYIGRYNIMAADDFSMCKEMHHVVTEGGRIGGVFAYALSYVVKSYRTWIGCYSVSFLDVFNPGVFGEQFTWITPVIMAGSVSGGIICNNPLHNQLFLRKRCASEGMSGNLGIALFPGHTDRAVTVGSFLLVCGGPLPTQRCIICCLCLPLCRYGAESLQKPGIKRLMQ